jgi:hypothetical protein
VVRHEGTLGLCAARCWGHHPQCDFRASSSSLCNRVRTPRRRRSAASRVGRGLGQAAIEYDFASCGGRVVRAGVGPPTPHEHRHFRTAATTLGRSRIGPGDIRVTFLQVDADAIPVLTALAVLVGGVWSTLLVQRLRAKAGGIRAPRAPSTVESARGPRSSLAWDSDSFRRSSR